MNVLAGIAARRLAAIALSFAISTAIPYLLQDKPKLKWAWDNFGPRIVDVAKDRLSLDSEA